ncbi:DUF4416 family protein [bacterium]|nr:DUF4416 family protein [bacterium]
MNQGPAKGRVEPVKLFAAILYSEESLLERARERLSGLYGPEDFVSEPFPFEHTDFYEAEMGAGLKRIFVAWERLVHPGALAQSKLATDRIERELAAPGGNRQVNVDPGTLDYQKVVLASFKYMGQKIFIGEGVWADLTLYYRKGGWAKFEWTFPDFKLGAYDSALLEIRRLYKRQMLEPHPEERP